MSNQASITNLNIFQNFIFHFLFLFILSTQIVFTNYYLNTLYILGLMIFIRADFEYDWKLILIISFYGLYQDALLGFQFGYSSLFFLFFLFLGQISNLVSRIGSYLINIYFFAFGVFLLAVLEGIYLYFVHNIFIDIYKLIINMVFIILLCFFLKKNF
tara:strand:+ start:306 stop:779 length:474 start_codon:yes stop_codon:yes gene_type:complete